MRTSMWVYTAHHAHNTGAYFTLSLQAAVLTMYRLMPSFSMDGYTFMQNRPLYGDCSTYLVLLIAEEAGRFCMAV